MGHSAFEADEETEQLGEPGAVQRAGGAVGRRLYGERVAHARDGDVALAPQLTGEHGAGRAPGGYVPEGPGAGARGEPGEHEEAPYGPSRSEEHTSELQSRLHLVCRLLLEKKKKK